MRILFLTPGFPENEQDTTCIPALQDFMAAFARLHPEAVAGVIAFQYPYTRGTYRWRGVEVYACGGRGAPKLRRLNTWLQALRQAHRIHRQNPITLVHSFWLSECALVGQWLSRWWGVPHVATIMGQDVRPTNRYLKRLNLSRMAVACGSPHSAAHFRKATGREVTRIIHWGLEPALLLPPTNSPDRDIDLLGVGALTPLKNYSLFVETVARLKEDFPRIRAVLIGDGPERARLEQMIAEHHLGKHLRLTGHLPRPEVGRYMQRSRILVHPSTFEAQAHVFKEALYYGMWVVSYDVGHVPFPERIYLCREPGDFSRITRNLLSRTPEHRSVLLKSMERTVEEYWQLYPTELQPYRRTKE